MTFEQLIEVVHGLQSEMTPETGARGAEDLASEITLLASVNLDVDAVLAFATSGKPVAEHDIGRLLRWPRRSPASRRAGRCARKRGRKATLRRPL